MFISVHAAGHFANSGEGWGERQSPSAGGDLGAVGFGGVCLPGDGGVVKAHGGFGNGDGGGGLGPSRAKRGYATRRGQQQKVFMGFKNK